MSRYYIDKGAHRYFRYEARGGTTDCGHALGSFHTKEQALEAVLEEKRNHEIYKHSGPGSWED